MLEDSLDMILGPLTPKAGLYLPLSAVLGGSLFLRPEGYALSADMTSIRRMKSTCDILCKIFIATHAANFVPLRLVGLDGCRYAEAQSDVIKLSPVMAELVAQQGYITCAPLREDGPQSRTLHCAIKVSLASVVRPREKNIKV